MDDEKYEKALKNAKWVALVILVLVIIIFILQMVSGQMKTVTMISGIIQMAFTYCNCLWNEAKRNVWSNLWCHSFNFTDTIFGHN